MTSIRSSYYSFEWVWYRLKIRVSSDCTFRKLRKKTRQRTTGSTNFRLLLELKNGPSILRRVILEALREETGKTCHLYIGGIIVFSNDYKIHL